MAVAAAKFAHGMVGQREVGGEGCMGGCGSSTSCTMKTAPCASGAVGRAPISWLIFPRCVPSTLWPGRGPSVAGVVEADRVPPPIHAAVHRCISLGAPARRRLHLSPPPRFLGAPSDCLQWGARVNGVGGADATGCSLSPSPARNWGGPPHGAPVRSTAWQVCRGPRTHVHRLHKLQRWGSSHDPATGRPVPDTAPDGGSTWLDSLDNTPPQLSNLPHNLWGGV